MGLTLGCALSLALAVLARADEPAPTERLALRSGGRTLPLALYLDGTSQRGLVTVGEGEARYTSPIYALWKAMAADLDGDGEDEILLGIWSQKPVHGQPNPHRTLWAMRWDGARIVPLWRGSSLARPLRDAVLADVDARAGHELLALERLEGTCSLTVYGWSGFGFYGLARRAVSCTAAFVSSTGCLLDRGRRRCAQLVEGKLSYR